MRKDILERQNEIIQWIEEKRSKAYICRQLECNHITLDSYLIKLGIDYKGIQPQTSYIPTSNTYVSAEDYAKKEICHSDTLKKKLFKEGIKEMKCESCGATEWLGTVIPLDLHHIDGNHYNNNLDNLQILCPNCHRVIGDRTGTRTKKHFSSPHYYCIDCGTEVSCSTVLRCRDCENNFRRANELKNMKVTREELKKLIRTMPFTAIGNQFNLSDAAIRKWCDKLKLPRTKKEINSYSDEEWEKI